MCLSRERLIAYLDKTQLEHVSIHDQAVLTNGTHKGQTLWSVVIAEEQLKYLSVSISDENEQQCIESLLDALKQLPKIDPTKLNRPTYLFSLVNTHAAKLTQTAQIQKNLFSAVRDWLMLPQISSSDDQAIVRFMKALSFLLGTVLHDLKKPGPVKIGFITLLTQPSRIANLATLQALLPLLQAKNISPMPVVDYKAQIDQLQIKEQGLAINDVGEIDAFQSMLENTKQALQAERQKQLKRQRTINTKYRSAFELLQKIKPLLAEPGEENQHTVKQFWALINEPVQFELWMSLLTLTEHEANSWRAHYSYYQSGRVKNDASLVSWLTFQWQAQALSATTLLGYYQRALRTLCDEIIPPEQKDYIQQYGELYAIEHYPAHAMEALQQAQAQLDTLDDKVTQRSLLYAIRAWLHNVSSLAKFLSPELRADCREIDYCLNSLSRQFDGVTLRYVSQLLNKNSHGRWPSSLVDSDEPQALIDNYRFFRGIKPAEQLGLKHELPQTASTLHA